jgi:hypothetical protein
MHLSSQLCGKLNRKTNVQEGFGINVRPYLKNTYSKKGWRCGSNGRELAQAVQDPEVQALVL